MNLFNIPLSNPLLYLLIAVIVSVYHGIRGYLIQRLSIDRLNGLPTERTRTEKIIVYFTYGFVSHFVLSLLGFASLYAVCEIMNTIPDLSKIETGTAIFLCFLSLVALAGIAGIYPLLDKLFQNFRN